MTENKTLSDMPPRGALAEGAEKFDRIARSLNPTLPAVQGGPKATAISPDEVWARSYMTYAIGGKAEPPAMAGFAPVAHLVSMPQFLPTAEPIVEKRVVEKSVAQRMAETVPPKSSAPDVVPTGPIGARIGKPIRRRSWLGRLFLGRA